MKRKRERNVLGVDDDVTNPLQRDLDCDGYDMNDVGSVAVSGTLTADAIDAKTAGALSIGAATATAITMGAPTTSTESYWGSCPIRLYAPNATDLSFLNPGVSQMMCFSTATNSVVVFRPFEVANVTGVSSGAVAIGATVTSQVNLGAAAVPTDIKGDFIYQKAFCEAYGDSMSNVTACTLASPTHYLANFGTDIVNTAVGFTVTTAGRLTYTGTRTRYFHLGCTLSFSDSKNADVTFSLHKNGTHLNGSSVHISAAGGATSTAIHKITSMATNDYLELYVESDTAANDVTVEFVNLFSIGLPNTV